MRLVAPATEDDMVLLFLCAEIDSSRFAATLLEALAELGHDRSLVDHADTSDPEQNAARREALAAARGYRRNEGVFNGFPDDISWSWAMLTPEELAAVRYIDWDYWLDVTGGTRRPADAIERMRGEWDAEGNEVRAMADTVARGSLPLEIILLGPPSAENLVVLEGHVRLSALLLRPGNLPAEVRVLLGTSPRIEEWGLYG